MRLVTLFLAVLLSAAPGQAQDGAADAARAALTEASTILRGGNYLQGLPLSERAVALAEKSGDRLLLARALTTLGRAQWDRITLAPDVELHVRRPLTREQNRQVERLIDAARDIFEEDAP